MKIYVIGDSISVHYGPYLETALAGFSEYARKGGPDANGTDWENPADANGGDSNLVRSFLTENLPAITTDFMLLNSGLHDIRFDRETCTHQVPIDSYRANLAAIIELMHRAGITPIWISSIPLIDEVHNAHPLPYQRFLADVIAYNEAAAEIMAKHAVSVIDLFTFTQSLGPDIYIDHVHVTQETREQQAHFIADRLKQLQTSL
ncbi:MAG: SGNH/GDSL hydrolase family protein [Opitutaceae bacterium]|jgi:lysophospholipase L1-like esterase|nr:SGNH/GDSL hydrolase family protein [Opitutaceae bacterium]